MKIIFDEYQNMNNKDQLTITLGNFDGVHIGHQRLIDRVLSYSDTKHAVLTFDPHPASVLRRQNFSTLTQKNDKVTFLRKYPLDYIFIVKFTEDFSKLSVSDFIMFLKKLNVKRVILGRDARFAYRGQGSSEDLKKYFFVDVLDDLLYNQMRVSTTYVKDFLRQGQLDLARKLLNKHYEIHGKVVYGNQIGKQLGFPTANIDYGNYFLPKNGVYYVNITIDHKTYPGIANIGYNPTLNYSQTKKLEVFILDFEGSIYKKAVTVEFLYYLREEQKFKDRDALIHQIKEDEAQVRRLLKH
ncbi:MAG: bifunctional riboflavin kinase/FAD synthetase [Acholeplasmataceae bacterium]